MPAAFRRPGLARVFAFGFYGYAVIGLAGAGRLRSFGAGDRGGALSDVIWIAVVWGVLYGCWRVADLAERDRCGWTAAMIRRFGASQLALAGTWVFLVVACGGVLAPVLTPADPIEQIDPSQTRYRPPSRAHPMGTDRLGRDVCARVLFGCRVSLSVALVSVALSVLIGVLVGGVAGFLGGWVDDLLMRIVDGLLAFPRLLVVLTLVALFASSTALVVAAIAGTGWMGMARLVRVEVARNKSRAFVSAAVATGVGRARLLWRHLLPNSAGPALVAATLNVGGVVLLESYLSFLGLGVQPPTPTWGAMVYGGRSALIDAWWASAFPAAAIVATVLACNLMGDGLRDALDIKLPPEREPVDGLSDAN